MYVCVPVADWLPRVNKATEVLRSSKQAYWKQKKRGGTDTESGKASSAHKTDFVADTAKSSHKVTGLSQALQLTRGPG